MKRFFYYSQKEKTITRKYIGRIILEGLIIGKQAQDLKIELFYYCLTIDGELKVVE
ncbi:hypothetical protein GCM10009430_32510 [Aquimarina litoralis]|uniref:Uncharacterized protein n=1 Tax=Aquimarina litoralis TaxID=584605 RepID=A0ABP3U9F3_9FLAO